MRLGSVVLGFLVVGSTFLLETTRDSNVAFAHPCYNKETCLEDELYEENEGEIFEACLGSWPLPHEEEYEQHQYLICVAEMYGYWYAENGYAAYDDFRSI